MKIGTTGAVVIVVAGVGAYLALQPQPVPTPVATPRPPTPPVAAPATPPPAPVVTPSPVAPRPSPSPTPAVVSPTPTPSKIDKAITEGSAMLYSSFDEDTVKGIVNGFMKKYPKIKTEYVRASGEALIQRFMTEARAKKYIADLVVTQAVEFFEPLREGLVDPYYSPEAAAHPPALKDPNGLWVVVQYSPQVVAYNTELVKGTDIPQSYWDIVKPRFKDKIGVYNPPGELQWLLISEKKIIGSARWTEWLKALKAQNPKNVRGSGPLLTLLKNREIELAVGAFTGSTTVAIKAGAPVDYVRKPNMALAPPSIVFMHKNAPHPNAGRLLYDYIISHEGQTLVNDMGKYVIARPGIPEKAGVGIGTGEPLKREYIATLWPFTEKDLEEALAKWKTVFPLE